MTKVLKCDICVIGAGSAGLSVAAAAAQLGARTVLFERGEMGGDCLNYGCVPSKALLAAAHAAQDARAVKRFGVVCPAPEIDFQAVMGHVRGVISSIAPHDSVERFEGLGVTVIKAQAKFSGPREICGGGFRVRAKRIVIATGSTAIVPPIPGIDTVKSYTNETIFSLEALPKRLLIIGGGPIGVEMAQAFHQLGSHVTLLEGSRLLGKDEPEFVDLLRQRLLSDGIDIREGVKVSRVTPASDGIELSLGDDAERITGSHLLIAAGRRPRLEGLDLAAAGVAATARGITVDARLRTTNSRIYAAGDVAGGPQFTHIASYHAGIIVRDALFRLPAKVDYRALPWVTYCSPELAHVGMTETEARNRFGSEVQITSAEFAANDRAQAERETCGRIKVVMRRSGVVVGATILGAHAGDLIQTWALMVAQGLKLGVLNGVVFPYPTLGEISKAAVSTYYAPKLFSKWPKMLVRLLGLFG